MALQVALGSYDGHDFDTDVETSEEHDREGSEDAGFWRGEGYMCGSQSVNISFDPGVWRI